MIEYVHKSQIATIKKCSRQLYYKDIMKLQEGFTNETGIAGSAFHKFAEEIYRSDKKDKWDDWQYWTKYWIRNFQKLKEEKLEQDIEVNTVDDLKSEEYLEMIVGFLKQPYNRFAEPIILEKTCRFEIKRGKKVYKFESTLDQLLRIPIKYLMDFWMVRNAVDKDMLINGKPYVYIHRDVKTGAFKVMSEIGLLTNDDLNIYAYGLAHGKFDLKGTGKFDQKVQLIPFAHALYYTRDHLKYKRDTEKKKKGDDKGPGMFLVKKDLSDLKNMEEELINLHIKVNSGNYTRDGASNNLCDQCGWRKICIHDWKNP